MATTSPVAFASYLKRSNTLPQTGFPSLRLPQSDRLLRTAISIYGGAASLVAIETILVPLGVTSTNEAALDTGIAVARRFNAHLEVLHIHRLARDAVPFVDLRSSLKETVIEAEKRKVEEEAAYVRARFEEICTRNQIQVTDEPNTSSAVTAAWFEGTSDAVIERGRLVDLIMVARPPNGPSTPATLEAALFETGRPVLLVPPISQPSIATRVAVGWNSSAEAARAVATATPVLQDAEAVTLLCSKKREENTHALAEHLAWHGITSTVHVFKTGIGSVGETLLAEARKLKADLMVVGGYSHTRARQLLFGGVTRHFLAAADIPVWMAH